MPPVIFRKGLDLKEEVAGSLARDYHSAFVERVKETDFQHVAGRVTLHLAREFGFCYGVERAVDYAYQTRKRFPQRNVFLTGEIIHNPHVNDKLRAVGIRFLSDPGERADQLGPDDVVIIPAFGLSIGAMARLDQQGCTLVDTTCGSVLNVWKNVIRYAQDGFTAVIHGKVYHEETHATASQALKYPNGRYLIVLDRDEADEVCAYIRTGEGTAIAARFAQAVSPGFDFGRDLQRIGLANQTTMLSTESLAIGEMFRVAMRDRYGEEALADRFRAFDTICSATQDRQDAVLALLDEQPLDLMLVIGGYNSSNTRNLARICAARVPTYHIADADRLLSATELQHHPVDVGHPAYHEVVTRNWLPQGRINVGLTAGASTPNNIIGHVLEKLALFATSNPASTATPITVP